MVVVVIIEIADVNVEWNEAMAACCCVDASMPNSLACSSSPPRFHHQCRYRSQRSRKFDEPSLLEHRTFDETLLLDQWCGNAYLPIVVDTPLMPRRRRRHYYFAEHNRKMW